MSKIPRFPEAAVFKIDGKELIPNSFGGIADLGIGKNPTEFIAAWVDGGKYPVTVSALEKSGFRTQTLFRNGIVINMTIGNGNFEYEIDNNVKYSDLELSFMETSLIPFIVDFVGLFFAKK